MSAQKHKLCLVSATLQRWLDLLLLAVIAFLTCVLLHPSLSSVGDSFGEIIAQWKWFVKYPVVSAIAGLLWFGLIQLGGFRLRDLWFVTTLRYPPVWLVAIATGIGLSFGMRHLGTVTSISFVTLETRHHLADLGIILIGPLVPAISCAVYSAWRKKATQLNNNIASGNASMSLKNLIDTPSGLIGWIQEDKPIKIPTHDLFGLSLIARRIAGILQESPLKTIGLIGPYGCGKSSVLNMADYYLNKSKKAVADTDITSNKGPFNPRHVIACRIGGWGFREGAAAERILKHAIDELSYHVDCLGLIRLPEHYRFAISNTGSFWLKIVAVLVYASKDPVRVLRQLDNVLKCIDRRLVIYLEDIERNENNDLFLTEISSLLDRLKELDNVSFVLAINYKYEQEDVLTRIFEHRDTIPHLAHKDVFKLLRTFRKYCLDKYAGDIDCLSDKEREKRIKFDRSSHIDLFAQIDELMKDVIDDIARLLINPRVLKVAMRRTWQAWERLHGELDFDDLLICNVLRSAAPQAFMFINKNAPVLRSLASESDSNHGKKRIEQNRQNLLKELEAKTKDVQWDVQAANNLINFLFPGWIEKRWNRIIASPQGVGRSEPTDYWVRLNREEIAEDEIRDQKVIHAIDEWKKNNGAKVYDGFDLPKALFEVEGFADKVELFGSFLDGNEVRNLAGGLFKLILEGEKVKVKADQYFGFLQLWRLSLNRPVDSHEEWIQKEIFKTLPISLRFANDLYYYWRHCEPTAARVEVATPELRQAIVAKAKEVYADNPDRLIEALDPHFMYSVYHLVKLYSKPEYGGTGFNPGDWQWLGTVLLQAAAKAPQVVVPQIVPLVIDSGQQFKGGTWNFVHKFGEEEPIKLFGQNGLAQVMALLLQDIEMSRFDKQGKAMIEFAWREAKKWLSEHKSEPIAS